MAWTFAVKLIVLARGIISFTLEGGTRKNTRLTLKQNGLMI